MEGTTRTAWLSPSQQPRPIHFMKDHGTLCSCVLKFGTLQLLPCAERQALRSSDLTSAQRHTPAEAKDRGLGFQKHRQSEHSMLMLAVLQLMLTAYFGSILCVQAFPTTPVPQFGLAATSAASEHRQAHRTWLLLSQSDEDTRSSPTATTKVTTTATTTTNEPATIVDWDDDFDTNTDFDETFSDDGSSSSMVCAVDLEDLTTPYMSSLESESTFIDYGPDGFVVPAGPVGQFKERVGNLLELEPRYEVAISASILLSSFLAALSTIDDEAWSAPMITMTIRGVMGVVLAVDFLGRWFSSSQETWRFVLSPQFVLDMTVVVLPLLVLPINLMAAAMTGDLATTTTPAWITMVPSILSPDTAGLFNLQLLRILRWRRVLKDPATFAHFEKALGVQFPIIGRGIDREVDGIPDWQLQLARVFLTLFTLVSVATGLIYTVEHSINPSINSYFDALYFGLTTVTTVGFGDISPVTTNGRIVVCGSILVGGAVVPTQLAELAEALISSRNLRKQAQEKMLDEDPAETSQSSLASDMNSKNNGTQQDMTLRTDMQCPHCGVVFHWSCARYCYSCGERL